MGIKIDKRGKEGKGICGVNRRCQKMDRSSEYEIAMKRRSKLGADGGVVSEGEEGVEPQMEKEVRGARDVKRGRKHRGAG